MGCDPLVARLMKWWAQTKKGAEDNNGVGVPAHGEPGLIFLEQAKFTRDLIYFRSSGSASNYT